MLTRWEWLVGLLTRRLWFRAGLYGFAAIATALVAIFVSPLIPEELSDFVGADAIRGILSILASSMLAVATFSLGTMVAAFAAAASAATPRASRLLVEDRTSQNVLSTFIGAFIFSLVGLIALSTGIYGPAGRIVLFAVTLLVIAAVLTTFFHWIDYLSNLHRLSETLEKVERAAMDAMCVRRDNPYLRCARLQSVPDTAFAHPSRQIGYVQHLDVAALQEAAEEADGQVWVGRLPGALADPVNPLFWTSWPLDDDARTRLDAAFLVGHTRSFEQDPRFGLIVLSEIASRALSPGINDPGTAIDVIGRVVRVLSVWAQVPEQAGQLHCDRVFMPEILVDDMFDDAFGPIARDAAGTIEVGIRLQKALRTLARFSPSTFGSAARRHSELAMKLSATALELDEQRRVLGELAAWDRSDDGLVSRA